MKAATAEWQSAGKVQRLWKHDASLWTNTDEAKWLGWLDVTGQQIVDVAKLKRLAEDVKREGFSDVLLLGMGGSSLCPEVLEKTFGRVAGFPQIHVLDSTDPAQVKAFEKRVDLAKTLFIVSSKSVTTLEPNIFKQYFLSGQSRLWAPKKLVAALWRSPIPDRRCSRSLKGITSVTSSRLPTIGGRYSSPLGFRDGSCGGDWFRRC